MKMSGSPQGPRHRRIRPHRGRLWASGGPFLGAGVAAAADDDGDDDDDDDDDDGDDDDDIH